MIVKKILKTYINWEDINKLLDNAILVYEFLVLEKCVLVPLNEIIISIFFFFFYLIVIYIYLQYVAKVICREVNHGRTNLPVW